MAQRVLVVDDDPPILALVSEILAEAGYEVRGTPSAVEGLRLLEAERPDLVVLDMRMPVIDGWRFKREMVARDLDVPIVVMTAAQNARQWALEIGAVGYVAKPFDIDELLRVVSKATPADTGDSTLSCSIEERNPFRERERPGAGARAPLAVVARGNADWAWCARVRSVLAWLRGSSRVTAANRGGGSASAA